MLEKDITLDIAQRLRQLLEDRAFQVMTRSDDSAISLAERAAIANRQGADVFVSVHVNWIENHAARASKPTSWDPFNDPALGLAASENRGSGYSMADMRQLLDCIYAGVRQDKSRQLAQMVQASLFRSLGKVNPKVEDRGVKSAPFISPAVDADAGHPRRSVVPVQQRGWRSCWPNRCIATILPWPWRKGCGRTPAPPAAPGTSHPVSRLASRAAHRAGRKGI